MHGLETTWFQRTDRLFFHTDYFITIKIYTHRNIFCITQFTTHQKINMKPPQFTYIHKFQTQTKTAKKQIKKCTNFRKHDDAMHLMLECIQKTLQIPTPDYDNATNAALERPEARNRKWLPTRRRRAAWGAASPPPGDAMAVSDLAQGLRLLLRYRRTERAEHAPRESPPVHSKCIRSVLVQS